MSLSVKHLNADSSFLLTFSPPYASKHPHGTCPGSFTILLDPWVSGPSKVFHSKFALTERVIPACIDSLAELPDPDLVLISQDKPDHCHQETLKQLPSDTGALILGTSAAAKKIRGWKYFDPMSVQSLRVYNERREDTVYRIPIPSFSPYGSEGEVTVTLLSPKLDITGLHNAIGITYRPPSSVLSAKVRTYVNLPPQQPLQNQGSRPTTPTPDSTTLYPSPFGMFREKTISVLYSPHGVDYNVIRPYASSHLLSEAALPLTALLHSFDRLTNVWYFGGLISAGSPSGMEIARNLFAKIWISAHDEEKTSTGIVVHTLKLQKFNLPDVEKRLRSVGTGTKAGKTRNTTTILALDAGQEYIIPAS